MSFAIGGFADLWLYSDRGDSRTVRRELRQSALDDPCETCGAKAGEPCHRPTVAGPVPRRLPHVGRGDSSSASAARGVRGTASQAAERCAQIVVDYRAALAANKGSLPANWIAHKAEMLGVSRMTVYSAIRRDGYRATFRGQ